MLGFAGMATLMTGGYLGGHLSLSKGVGPDRTVFDPGPTGWNAAADASFPPSRFGSRRAGSRCGG
jgi:hypothetical protein